MKVSILPFKGKILEWAQNTTGMTPAQITYSRVGWGNRTCYRCHGIVEYVYHVYWQCRDCGQWSRL